MALAKPVGAVASAAGLLAGGAAIVTALGDPDTSACIARVAGALGPHAAQIGLGLVGAISAITPIVAWFAHAPLPLTPQQQLNDDRTHGVTP